MNSVMHRPINSLVWTLLFGTVMFSVAILPLAATPQDQAGTQAPRPTYLAGEIQSLDVAARRIILTTANGEVQATFTNETEFLKVPPGEKTLEKGTPVEFSSLQPGDKVIARGRVAPDGKSVPARQIIVVSKADIAQRNQREAEDWRRRGISAAVISVGPAKGEITAKTIGLGSSRTMAVAVNDKTLYRRYAPDSVHFADAKPSSLAEIKPGDQLRALGNKDEAETRVDAEVVVFGTFVMVGGPIKAVDAQAGTISIQNLPTKKPLTVVINKDSVLRRIPEQMATMMARRLNASVNGTNGNPGRSFPGAATTAQPGASSGGQGQARGSEGLGSGAPTGPGGPRRGGDLSEMFQRLPAVSINDLKPGELIMVSSTVGNDPDKVTAILLAAGVEPLLTLPSQGDTSSFNFPSGVLDMGMGLP